jgi:hypothetical protein
MNLQETLTKENFWNEVMATYPNATKLFCDWIDEYKKEIEWDYLFANGIINRKPIKFHDIPHAMQQGIWIEFVEQTLHQYFEQPEYEYSGDLEEDIKTVLGEIEVEIK